MFKKIVVVDNTGIDDIAKNHIKNLGEEAHFYNDYPTENSEIISRIGDADCLLVSYLTLIPREVIEACPNLTYIGMCCSLFDESSANVDVACARERGIRVLGVKDYGDEGVVEYIVSELIRLLHGFGEHQWQEKPNELTNQKIGILGLGTTGMMTAEALKFFGADMYYYSRTRKPEAEAKGIKYLPFQEFLKTVDIVTTNLPKNTIIFNEREFELLGNGKILVNIAIGPTFSVPALKRWLENKENYYLCDAVGMGAYTEELGCIDNVLNTKKGAASSVECTKRLSEKVVANIKLALN